MFVPALLKIIWPEPGPARIRPGPVDTSTFYYGMLLTRTVISKQIRVYANFLWVHFRRWDWPHGLVTWPMNCLHGHMGLLALFIYIKIYAISYAQNCVMARVTRPKSAHRTDWLLRVTRVQRSLVIFHFWDLGLKKVQRSLFIFWDLTVSNNKLIFLHVARALACRIRHKWRESASVSSTLLQFILST